MGTLYIVATPIGNLEDITLRALRMLKEVDCILCEDTRVTKKLLARYEISRPVMSYHAHSSDAQSERILRLLDEGKNLALVTDAGTPGISDPGALLVARARTAGARIETIPGPSALTAALSGAGVSGAGVSGADFLFLGFLPHKKGRRTIFNEIAESKRVVVFYESPHRLIKTLESLREHVPERRIIVARELTKIHESFEEGTPAQLLAHFLEYPDQVRGEIVILAA